MRKVAVYVLLLGFFLPACVELQTPRQKWAAAEAAYQSALIGATEAAKAGLLELDDVEKIEYARLVARASLNQAEHVLTDTNRTDNDALYWIARAVTLVDEIVRVTMTARTRAKQ